MWWLSSALTEPLPSDASTSSMTSSHQVWSTTFRVAPASSIARQPSGQCSSVEFELWISAATPAHAGDAMLVPLLVRFTAVTLVPLAEISGSSRSPWLAFGLRKTELADMAEAVSL